MSIYKTYSELQLEEHFSNFLMDSWSFSKVQQFSRHEKAFEMQYIYNEETKNSATTIAGQAYHHALEHYFKTNQEGSELQLADLEALAFEFIEEVEPNKWKLQKTTPTVEESQKKATSVVTSLLRNFYAEKAVYEDQVKTILDVEVKTNEFLTINGVDVPLPCRARIDLVIETIDGKIVIIDHKSRHSFTAEDEFALSTGSQAITYVKSYEAHSGLQVDEVWFVENKYSQNRDKSAQLIPYKIKMDDDTRRLYEALLYEPLRKMISAVNDPDFVYLINDSDNFVDRAEIYNFWSKTMIAEVEEFNIPEDKKELITKRLKKIRDVSVATVNPKAIREFRKNASQFIQYDLSNSNMTQEEKIEHVLRTFGSMVRVAHKFDGYSSNTYLLEVSAGTKISSIQNHRLDIANALNVSSVRISKELRVHEGKSYLQIEFSKKRDKNLEWDKKEVDGMKIPVGKDNFGNTIYWDLGNHSTPHALVCGSTGSGKSVALKSMIEYAKEAGVKDILVLDPKFEFRNMNISGIEIVSQIEDIEAMMGLMVEEMEKRVKSGQSKHTLIVFDEFADAQANSRKGKSLDRYEMKTVGFLKNGKEKVARVLTGTDKSLEENLRVLLQKGRSVGFRIIAATQRASTKIITGDAKANFPVQICFRVPKEVDSRVVIDEPGAESLAGAGDFLIKSPDYPELVRGQAFYKP
jgi:S-DNA-T family DNA segregation ATPase FtsK/SpoIIIE